jgi:hypothetical protein
MQQRTLIALADAYSVCSHVGENRSVQFVQRPSTENEILKGPISHMWRDEWDMCKAVKAARRGEKG